MNPHAVPIAVDSIATIMDIRKLLLISCRFVTLMNENKTLGSELVSHCTAKNNRGNANTKINSSEATS
jgi:hypothetical protein